MIKNLPHATTIVAAACERGVVMAGDRRATAGNMISKRDVEKVFRSDEFSAMAIAGVFAIGIEFVRLFQVELEHYEKMEGRSLSLEGKANRLAKMVRDNLGPAMQGLAVVPLFTGYDEETGVGRIFSYDVAGGPYEEHRFYSIGSGSIFAQGSLKKLYRDDMSDLRRGRSPACRRSTTRPTTTRPPVGPTSPGSSSRSSPRSPTTASGGCQNPRPPRSRSRSWPAGCSPPTVPTPRSGRPADRRRRRLKATRPDRPCSPSTAKEAPAVSMPFYVSPEQQMRDKSDYARKGVGRSRSSVVLQYAGGILMATPNASTVLHKISEIYDRIAFAAVGRYNEYEVLRKAGVTYADLTGYSFDRGDVTARGLANWYAQQLGTSFTESMKPYEVEIVVAEVGARPDDDQIYRISWDGSVSDEPGFVAFGGQADQVSAALKEAFSDNMSLTEALGAAHDRPDRRRVSPAGRARAPPAARRRPTAPPPS